MNAQRGSVMIESAISILLLCSVMYGTMQFGIIAFNQASGDGAAFISARQQALNLTEPAGTPLSAAAKTQQIYPTVSSGNIATGSGLPPTADVGSVQYALTQTDARHGGYSLVQPVQEITNVARTGIKQLALPATGSGISLYGVGSEPAFLEFGVHEDLSGAAANSSAAFSGAVNFFTDGENTPPYFVGFHFITYCPSTGVGQWQTCPEGNANFDSLGTAEYLDIDNWSRLQTGIGSGAIFEDVRLHQNTFATLSAAVAANDIDELAANQLNINNATMQCMYNTWDSHQAGGYPDNYTAVGQYPLHPDTAC